jgi:hypothetical protein
MCFLQIPHMGKGMKGIKINYLIYQFYCSLRSMSVRVWRLRWHTQMLALTVPSRLLFGWCSIRISAGTPTILVEVSVAFFGQWRKIVGHWSGYECFLPQFTIHQSPDHQILYSLDTGSVVQYTPLKKRDFGKLCFGIWKWSLEVY